MLSLGTIRPGRTLFVPFETFSGTTGAPITLTGLALADILVYKDGGTTQRISTSGYTLLDTDGIDFDGITGIHGFSIDLADNTTADFWACGSTYFVVVSAITVDNQTMSFLAAHFKIGYDSAVLNTTLATLATQTSFTLTVGPAEDDALKGALIVLHDTASAVQQAFGVVQGYTGSTKTVTLVAAPTFTIAAKDNISFFPPALVPTVFGRTLDVSATGEAGVDWANVGSPTTALNLSGTNIDVDQVVASVSGAVASVTGAVGSIASGGIAAASFAAGAIDAAAIATDAIGANELAAGAITEIQSGLATAAALAIVQADTDDIQNRLPAALVSGRIDASVGAMAADVLTAAAIATDAIGSAELAASAVTEIQTGLATAAALVALNNLSAVQVENAVWDAVMADHLDVGSTGVSLNGAGSVGDPWTTAIPGAYGAGTAGNIVGTNLNTTVSSRASQASVDTVDDFLDTEIEAIKAVTDALPNAGALTTIQADLDNLQTRVPAALVSGRIDASVGAMATDTLTAAALAADAVTELQTGLSTLTAAGVRTAVGLASANLDTQLDDLPTAAELATALSTADDATLVAIAALNNLSVAGVRTAIGLTSANLDTQLAAIQSDADNLQTRVPAALVGGRMDVSVGAMAIDTLTAAALAADAVTELQSGVSTLTAAEVRTAVGLASANLDMQLADLPTNAELATALGAADDATLAAIAALNNLSQAQVRTAVGLASANLDTQLDALPTTAELATALGTADDATLAAIAALNNLSAAQVNAEADTALTDAGLTTAIQADLDNLQTRLPTTLVGGRIDASVGALNGSVTAAQNLERSASAIYRGTITAASTSTVLFDSGLTQSGVDHWKGRIVIFTSGALAGQATDILAFTPPSDTLTVTALTAAPAVSDQFVIV